LNGHGFRRVNRKIKPANAEIAAAENIEERLGPGAAKVTECLLNGYMLMCRHQKRRL
jgi:hypothetical protein